ncbi:5-formyltetrahydrofolate cyclo-ligase [Candidatus Kinetoplastibacterium desouzaii TCC079E]|uniref:5-formyltetrahydrofolate cyclo-ligase n=1 Tax=Candidatus Kinetoplastidibacterium desouzai TCC079E TaxID=1208919 RepID=M1LT05_9PROT|nr:5-formyltetrahydrofolate cyclo-ligase [Candidatus Kinetoplastibacterium desouzaii]AGF47226.1 5-formyltetrahydrofolate cyclo-ligase [Candidatus Kinetoplastibacterium desouzaii TCC079E]
MAELQYNNEITRNIRSELLTKRTKIPMSRVYEDSAHIQKKLLNYLEKITNNFKHPTNNKINIAGFWPIDKEPNLIDLLNKLSTKENIIVCLPSIYKKNHPLHFKQWTPNHNMIKGIYNILEPNSQDNLLPNILLVPTLGFTIYGDRIGYGKGYYDRTLSNFIEIKHKFLTIGISWTCGLITNNQYKAASHDIKLDGILTEDKWIKEPLKEINKIIL